MIGLIVNPIAGMGGKVALKGTDGVVEEAIRRGAKPVSPDLVRLFLRELSHYPESDSILFLTGPGPLGEDYLREFGFRFEVLPLRKIHYRRVLDVYIPDTSAKDTRELAREMLGRTKLIVFAGGDGTAKDVVSIVDRKVPILGIPTGVKMYSGVFAISPEKAAEVLVRFLRGEAKLEEREVRDIDEDSFRRDEIRARTYGKALVPVFENLVQGSKESVKAEEGEDLEALADAIAEEIIESDGIYFLGSGSTLKMIKDRLGIDGTLLGVDVVEVRNGKVKLLVKDATERDLLRFADRKPKIVVTVVGGANFLFGRGNQQFSPAVLRGIPKENLIVVATPSKVRNGYIRIYTGDREVDDKFRGYIRVRVSPWIEKLVRVV
ncbi:ATP-NAD kinase family protein [Thermococcus sp.]